jgi:hypothetical protein
MTRGPITEASRLRSMREILDREPTDGDRRRVIAYWLEHSDPMWKHLAEKLRKDYARFFPAPPA